LEEVDQTAPTAGEENEKGTAKDEAEVTEKEPGKIDRRKHGEILLLRWRAGERELESRVRPE
jgi:hypothetical protein